MIQKQVGLRIREIRQSKHLSQEDFSFCKKKDGFT